MALNLIEKHARKGRNARLLFALSQREHRHRDVASMLGTRAIRHILHHAEAR